MVSSRIDLIHFTTINLRVVRSMFLISCGLFFGPIRILSMVAGPVINIAIYNYCVKSKCRAAAGLQSHSWNATPRIGEDIVD